MSRDVVLGIDFGTSYSSAGAIVDGKIELVVDDGDAMIPSLVYLPRTGAAEVGHRALAMSHADPTATVTSIKRFLGVDPAMLQKLTATMPYRLKQHGDHILIVANGRDYACEQIAATILSRLRELAERRFGGTLRRAVVTVPAVATPAYVHALRRAAKIAHLELLETVAEPIAGALASGLHHEPGRRRVLVCDFGGGTFDVTCVIQDGLRFSPVVATGDAFLGGDDFDVALADAVAGVVYQKTRFDMMGDIVRRAQLLRRCETVKRTLSTAREAPLVMRDAYINDGAFKGIEVLIERSWIAPRWAPIIERAIGCVESALGQANWRVDQLDRVVLIGGTSLVPAFRDALAAVVGRSRMLALPLAGVAVAMGAVMVSARHNASVPILPEITDDDIPIEIDLARAEGSSL